MARVGFNRNLGMVVLYGLASFVAFPLPTGVLAGLAIVAGVLILAGR